MNRADNGKILLALITSLTCFSAPAWADETKAPQSSEPMQDSQASVAKKTEEEKPKEPVGEPPKQIQQDPEYHRVQMKLSGSMCFSCLHELQKALLKIDGIAAVKVEKAPVSFYQPYSPEMTTWANAVLYYDRSKLQLNDLRAVIKENGYHAYKMQDKQTDKLPEEASASDSSAHKKDKSQ